METRMPKKYPNTQLKMKFKQYHSTRSISNLKRQVKDITLKQMKFEWDYGGTGRTKHKYVPRLVSCKLLSKIYTGHEAFPTYLHRFVKKDAPECKCGEFGTPKNYLTTCLLTKSLHLVNKTQNNKQLWHH